MAQAFDFVRATKTVGGGLADLCATTTEDAPPVAVFDGWVRAADTSRGRGRSIAIKDLGRPQAARC